MKTLYLPIILVASVAAVGLVESLWVLANNSQTTLALRFSQQFFTIYTLVPLCIIAMGVVIFSLVFRKRYQPNTKYQITLFGFLVMFVGFEAFSLYLVD